LQSRQKHFDSLPAQSDNDNEDVKGFRNQAMVRKKTAPGFIYVPAGPISALAPDYCASGALDKPAK
jgi:hypothetical protein